jgi:hypothetical protein
MTLISRWCSAARQYQTGPHTAQTTFSGIDNNNRLITVVSPLVTTLSP